MEKLSLKSYGWKCVLGGEVIYIFCLIYGAFFLPTRVFDGLVGTQPISLIQLHHLFFELLPGFTWINIESVLLGAIYAFIFSWIFAWYYVWMHNSSLVKAEK